LKEIYEEGYMVREDEEEDVNSCWMTCDEKRG
jgi:hypothetical protein